MNLPGSPYHEPLDSCSAFAQTSSTRRRPLILLRGSRGVGRRERDEAAIVERERF